MKKNLLTLLLSCFLFANTIPAAAAEITVEEYMDPMDSVSVEEVPETTQEEAVADLAEDEQIPIDAAHFPDQEFRRYFADPSIDKDQNGKLSIEERADVTELYSYYEDYEDMTGVEYFFNLTYLELIMPESAEYMNFSQMPHLETLRIISCNFSTLDLTNNPELKTLIIESKASGDIQLSENNQIEKMELRDKQGIIRSFDFLNKLHKIKDLQLSLQKNREYAFDFSPNQNLERLTISSATLTSLNLTQNPALVNLSIDAADILCETIDLSQNTNLKYGRIETGSASRLGFLNMDNCAQDISMYISQNLVLPQNEQGYYTLSDIPGYNPQRFASIQGGELKGNRLYPEERYITYTYYLNNSKKSKGTFKFDCGKQIHPEAVQGLNVTDITGTSLRCKWKPCTDPYSGYVVYVKNEDTGKNDKRIKVKKGLSTCKITGLKAGGKYTVIVRAYRSYQGKNYYSVYYKGTQTIYTTPPTPTLKVSKNSGGKVTFSWTCKRPAGSFSKHGYLIYYRQKGTNYYTALPEIPDTKNTYTTTDLKKGKTYYIKMRTYVKSKNTIKYFSAFTKPLTITVK